MMTGPGTNNRRLGRLGEELALAFLRKKKFVILETGFRMFRGEIDIVARDNGTLVFVEVKARASGRFGRPEESVTPAKQAQIRKLAQGYLTAHGLSDTPCRFDVIAVRRLDDGRLDIAHFPDAF
jgi:putative endonuclease